jgi:hypothetical protein
MESVSSTCNPSNFVAAMGEVCSPRRRCLARYICLFSQDCFKVLETRLQQRFEFFEVKALPLKV